jgi:hypothetical protein
MRLEREMPKKNRVGLNVKLTSSVLAEIRFGKHVILYHNQDWVAAICTLEATALVTPDGTRYEFDPTDPLVNGQPLYLLESIKGKIHRQTKKQSSIQTQTADIAAFYGDTYYLSHNVIQNVQEGDHYFIIGDQLPRRLSFVRQPLTVGPHVLKMIKNAGTEYAVRADTNTPIFLLARYRP